MARSARSAVHADANERSGIRQPARYSMMLALPPLEEAGGTQRRTGAAGSEVPPASIPDAEGLREAVDTDSPMSRRSEYSIVPVHAKCGLKWSSSRIAPNGPCHAVALLAVLTSS